MCYQSFSKLGFSHFVQNTGHHFFLRTINTHHIGYWQPGSGPLRVGSCIMTTKAMARLMNLAAITAVIAVLLSESGQAFVPAVTTSGPKATRYTQQSLAVATKDATSSQKGRIYALNVRGPLTPEQQEWALPSFLTTPSWKAPIRVVAMGALLMATLSLTLSAGVARAVSGGGLDYANMDITGQDFSNGVYKGKDFTQGKTKLSF
jgi:hypothetical protein